MNQTGFHGAKAWLISRMLKMGTRTMYGRRLPALLDELGGGAPLPSDDAACMNGAQRMIAGVLKVFTRRSP